MTAPEALRAESVPADPPAGWSARVLGHRADAGAGSRSAASGASARACRWDPPLSASDELLEETGQEPPTEPEQDAAEIIDEFKDFIENVSPEDFGA